MALVVMYCPDCGYEVAEQMDEDDIYALSCPECDEEMEILEVIYE